MKLLLLLVVLVLAVGLWKSRRPRAKPTPPPTPQPTPMVACQTCGLHLPASEALVTEHGSYCCAAHRDRAAAP